MNRRNYLALMGAAAAASTLDLVSAQQPATDGAPTTSTVEDRARRMKWWHEAKFGMFIHWGLYSTLGRHEWVMENEGIPAKEYEQYAGNFKPKPNFARDWARLAKRAGMKYMVLTSKTSRRLLQLRFKVDALLRHQKSTGPRSGARVRRGGAG